MVKVLTLKSVFSFFKNTVVSTQLKKQLMHNIPSGNKLPLTNTVAAKL